MSNAPEEVQFRMYQLTAERDRLQAEINKLDDQIIIIIEERRKIFYEFPTVDIYPQETSK